MKTAIIAGSVALNVAFIVLLFREPATSVPVPPPAPSAAERRRNTALRDSIVAGDFTALVAAGVPEATAHRLALGAAYTRYRAKLRAAQPVADSDPRYWRDTDRTRQPLTAAERVAIAAIEREFAETLIAHLGPDAALEPIPDARYDFLPVWKQNQLRRLESEYRELATSLRVDAAGLALPSDRTKLQALAEEKEGDVTALLSPEEYDMLEFRGSDRALRLMSRFGSGIENETDWRALYAGSKNYETKFGTVDGLTVISSFDFRAANEGTRLLYEDLRRTMGEERYLALQRAVDVDRDDIASLNRRLKFPSDPTEQIIAMREAYALETQRIALDSTSATEAQRSAQIKALATRATAELVPLLGSEAAEAYARRPNWVRQLTQGRPYTTDPSAWPMGPSTLWYSQYYPFVVPAPATPSNNSRPPEP